MQFHFYIGISRNPPRADESAVGTINRPLLRTAQCKSCCSIILNKLIKNQEDTINEEDIDY